MIKLNIQHIDAVVHLLQKVVKQMHADGKTHWSDTYPNREVLTDDILRQRAFGYFDGDKLLAYLVIDGVDDPFFADIQWAYSGTRWQVVHRLMVLPQAQGKGLARTCMTYAEQVAREEGTEWLRLDTHIGDLLTQHLYHSIGYTRLDIFTRPGWGDFYAYEKLL